MPEQDLPPLALKRIPESNKPFWRQLVQNARGRADLKQLSGLFVEASLVAIALILALRTGIVPDSLIYTLGGIAVLWRVGDATEAVAVLKALYGGFRPVPDVQNNNNVGPGSTLNQGGGAPNPADTCV